MPTDDLKAPTGDGLVDEIADWLITQSLGETEVKDLFEGCCHRLRATGIPLWRALLSFPTLHPLYASIWLTWYPGKGIGVVESLLGYTNVSEGFLQSPFHHMTETRIPFLRRRLVGDEAMLDFPILSEFRDKGATDYLAFVTPFDRYGHAMSGFHIYDKEARTREWVEVSSNESRERSNIAQQS